ncbi:hypothetical protein [Amycolatopsis sp. YIM 10]|uniref:hypothetical protein n=1 Tax=Amycolatopsis sp. YIM 10 TaxID=2653857 RepID=UPI0012900DEE|nr:hypothetical protein [Amycolatopsis sp. YIM 10]QFU89501.1 hypothetical protein YIM_21615 [Amycolatopsis sp. YIM 10]
MSAIEPGGQHVRVILPDEMPVLTVAAARVLLAILVELTEVPVLDAPSEGVSDDG